MRIALYQGPGCEHGVISMEYMDIDHNISSQPDFRSGMVFVVDTNVLMENFDKVIEIEEACNAHDWTILIPWVVLQELDSFKKSSQLDKYKKAHKARNYLHEKIGKDDTRIRGQGLQESFLHIYSNYINDDLIIDCAMFFQKKYKVLLLTADKNLVTKARVNGVETLDPKNLSIKHLTDSTMLIDRYCEDGKPKQKNTVGLIELLRSKIETPVVFAMQKYLGPEWVFFLPKEKTFYELTRLLRDLFIPVYSNIFPSYYPEKFKNICQIAKRYETNGMISNYEKRFLLLEFKIIFSYFNIPKSELVEYEKDFE